MLQELLLLPWVKALYVPAGQMLSVSYLALLQILSSVSITFGEVHAVLQVKFSKYLAAAAELHSVHSFDPVPKHLLHPETQPMIELALTLLRNIVKFDENASKECFHRVD